MSFNVFYTQGRLGGDPEVKVSEKDGDEYLIFQLAYQYRRNTRVHWFQCQAKGKPCEIIQELKVKKGDMVHLRGSLYQFPEDKESCKRQHLYIKVYQLFLIAPARTTESKHFKDVEQPKVGGETPPFA